MSRLEEIKNELAKERGYEDWFDLKCHKVYRDTIEQIQDECTKIYAKECAKASLEKASENIPKYGKTRDALKPIITNPENIVIL